MLIAETVLGRWGCGMEGGMSMSARLGLGSGKGLERESDSWLWRKRGLALGEGEGGRVDGWINGEVFGE